MNVSVDKGKLSPLEALKNGSVLIVTDQNTMGKPLGVAEGSAKALGKTTAFSVPETVEQEAIVMPEQTTVAVTEQSTILDGAVPVTENATMLKLGEDNLSRYQHIDYSYGQEPTNTTDAVASLVEEPKAVPVEMPVDVNEIPVADASGILMGDTGAIKQEDIVLENPAIGQITGIPEPQPLDTTVQLTGDMFNVAATLPEDGKSVDSNPSQNGTEVPNGGLVIDLPAYAPLPDDGKNIDLNPDGTKNPGEGLVIDLPAMERMDAVPNTVSTTEAVVAESTEKFGDATQVAPTASVEEASKETKLSPSQTFIKLFKYKMLTFIDELEGPLEKALSSQNVNVDEFFTNLIGGIDTTVVEGLKKIQDSVATPAVAPTTFDPNSVVSAQEASQGIRF